MTVRFDVPRQPHSMMDCPRCDSGGPHPHADGIGGEWTFQCRVCLAFFTDRPQGTPPSTWLPRP